MSLEPSQLNLNIQTPRWQILPGLGQPAASSREGWKRWEDTKLNELDSRRLFLTSFLKIAPWVMQLSWKRSSGLSIEPFTSFLFWLLVLGATLLFRGKVVFGGKDCSWACESGCLVGYGCLSECRCECTTSCALSCAFGYHLSTHRNSDCTLKRNKTYSIHENRIYEKNEKRAML